MSAEDVLLSGGREFRGGAVERTSWRCAQFTGDGEHVAAASASPDEHVMFIWSVAYGKLERVLTGETFALAALNKRLQLYTARFMPYLHQNLEMLNKAERTGQKTTSSPT